MIQKILLIIFIFSLQLVYIKCTPAIKKTPYQVAEQYVNFYCKGDFGNAYQLISDKDKQSISQKEFINSYYAGLPNSKKAIFKKRTCQLKRIKIINNTTATGAFIIQTPDYIDKEISALDKYYFLALIHPGANMTASIEKVDNELANTILSTTPSQILTDDKDIHLLYENNKWKIILNIEAKNESNKLFKEGQLLWDNKKYKEAKEKYRQALEKYPNNVSARAILDVLNSPKYKKLFEK